MARLIFVHGAFSNRNAWFDVPASVASAGHSVSAETLPGHHSSFPMLTFGATLQDYVGAVAGQLSSTEQNWLVGHSMGGMVISQLAAKQADQIAGLIYVAGVLPRDGQSTFSEVGLFNPLKAFRNHDRQSVRKAIGNQPREPLFARFAGSADFAAIPKFFFTCNQDKVIPPTKQARMISAYPDTQVYPLDSDHLPMHASSKQVSALPELLAGIKEIVST